MARYPVTPKLAVPLTLDHNASRFHAVEQDSTEEVLDCCRTILRTPIGDCIDEPELGVPDMVFTDPEAMSLMDALNEWEPRAGAMVTEEAAEELADSVLSITIDDMEAASG